MITNSSRSKERARALEELQYILKIKSKVLVVHYSCESFLNLRNRVPRITSIAIHNLESGQTHSFSIYLSAQMKNVDINKLTETARDQLEKDTLNEYYKFVRKHKTYKWVHWKMRNQVYGFEAINARYRILNGKPVCIADNNKYDLPRIIEQLYTSQYEKASEEGKFLSLAKRNKIALGNAISGYQEATAYEDNNHQLLWMSSQQKVKVISELLLLASNDELKVAATLVNVHGFRSLKFLKRSSLWSLFILISGMAGKEFLNITIKSLSDHLSVGPFILSILGLN
ncbi:hypothetical protein [uncultured Pontibacter sp.]|uniref:hypothetical protein n=1 Tax=uncultured Pontibacter sp. TaxID=453356 RepID=UPI0026300BC1|nr:hypothetical protein [uncultured Pontibacter sp.]